MANIYKFLGVVLLLINFIGCEKHDDSAYFNGDILPINSKIKKVKNVTLTRVVPLDGTNFGTIAVFDSLMLFWNPKLSDRFFNVFNLDTGADLGTYLVKGQGPNEVPSISPIYQLFEEGDKLKTLLYTGPFNTILKWNISESIRQQTTIIDTIIDYSPDVKNMGAYYDFIYFQKEDTLFTSVPAIPLSEEEASLPFYQKRTLYSNQKLKDYSIYKKSIKNGDAFVIPEAFYGSVGSVKPDGSKIVQAMKRLQQLNFLDVKTGKVIGYRMKESPDFSIFKTKKPLFSNYIRIQADDQFIYALFWGKEPWGIEEIPFINTIHIFDWEGNWLYELKTDLPIHEIWIDRKRNRLYTTNLDVDDVFYLDLDEIMN